MYDPSASLSEQTAEQNFQHQIRQMIRDHTPPDDFAQIVLALKRQAMNGDVASAKLLWEMVLTATAEDAQEY